MLTIALPTRVDHELGRAAGVGRRLRSVRQAKYKGHFPRKTSDCRLQSLDLALVEQRDLTASSTRRGQRQLDLHARLRERDEVCKTITARDCTKQISDALQALAIGKPDQACCTLYSKAVNAGSGLTFREKP